MIAKRHMIVKRRNNPYFSKGGLALIAVGLLFVSIALLCGCSGPSKKQYVVLLHECRDQNREHLRLVQEYDARTKDCLIIKHGEDTIGKLSQSPLWKAEAVEVCPANNHPEQDAGGAEMNLGGW